VNRINSSYKSFLSTLGKKGLIKGETLLEEEKIVGGKYIKADLGGFD